MKDLKTWQEIQEDLKEDVPFVCRLILNDNYVKMLSRKLKLYMNGIEYNFEDFINKTNLKDRVLTERCWEEV